MAGLARRAGMADAEGLVGVLTWSVAVERGTSNEAESAVQDVLAAASRQPGHPERLRSEAAWARLCGVAPIPASSGKVTRWRLNPGGNREANHALWQIVITRMSAHPATRDYVARRAKEGLSNAPG